MIFAEKNRNYFSRTLPTAKLKSAKNNRHIFEKKPRKFGDAKISQLYGIYIEIPITWFGAVGADDDAKSLSIPGCV